MKDLAARLGLSQTTVSHVLSGRYEEFRISAETVARVREMADKLGYRSNALARAFRERRTFSIGLVVEELSNPFWTGIARGAERVAEQHGYMLVVSNTSFELERERAALRLLQDGRVDGLLLPPFAHIDQDLVALHEEGLPFVQIDRGLAQVKAPCVRTDHALGSHLVVDHLAGRGHRRIVLVVGREEIQPYRLRTAGFEEAVAARGLGEAEIVRLEEATPDETQATVAALLARPAAARPTAIYAANVWMTIGTMRAARDAGLAVPEALEIVGFDDLPMADLMRFPVTTVAHDVDQIGREAMAALLKLRAGEAPPLELVIPPRLVVR